MTSLPLLSDKWTSQTKSKWAALELLILSLCLFLPKEAEAHVLVYKISTNQLLEDYNDAPADFGPSIPSNGLRVFAIPAIPPTACQGIDRPDKSQYPVNAKFVAIIQRGGGCSFELKVRNAQDKGYHSAIVYNNEGDDLETMSASNSTGIRIPSVFVGLHAGISLKSFNIPEVEIVINDSLPFNINTQLILPFSIMIGLCFLIMIFYMIYKCIREERRLRRNRLPKRLLKALPILKYSKNGDIRQETCVICIEDYVEGDKLRVLPCKHVYHTHCIDPWLTENRQVCPMCKRKVFSRGERRQNRRNAPVTVDTSSDSDDDTTPLLQPSSNAVPRGRRNRNTARNAPTTENSNEPRSNDTSTATANTNIETEETSDEENALLAELSAMRVNPFDRRPNLPPHLADQLNSGNQRSIWSYPILRLFRRQPPTTNHQTLRDARPVLLIYNSPEGPAAPQLVNVMPPAASTSSFREDDEIPHQTIYEHTEDVTSSDEEIINIPTGGDSAFIQPPVQGGIGVVALPNTTLTGNQSDATASTSTTDPRFWV